MHIGHSSADPINLNIDAEQSTCQDTPEEESMDELEDIDVRI